ncbi:hypothetical protein C8R45DRAFT_1211951 [Mycena sanguinolenta]|nr:hypothetical protein C8R45DRAFT_1211951 [Mycena sanguinolenta]
MLAPQFKSCYMYKDLIVDFQSLFKFNRIHILIHYSDVNIDCEFRTNPSLANHADPNKVPDPRAEPGCFAATQVILFPSFVSLFLTISCRNSISSGAVAGIVVAIILLCACAAAALFWRIRRRRLRHRQFSDDVEMRRGGRTTSPFTLLVEHPSFDTSSANAPGLATDSDARSISASSIARQQLETQLRAAMVKLEELAEGDPNAGGGVGGQAEHVSAARPAGSEAELRAQINMLVARMNAMDAAWGMGMGMGGEPPPEYA